MGNSGNGYAITFSVFRMTPVLSHCLVIRYGNLPHETEFIVERLVAPYPRSRLPRPPGFVSCRFSACSPADPDCWPPPVSTGTDWRMPSLPVGSWSMVESPKALISSRGSDGYGELLPRLPDGRSKANGGGV
ncbi:MAG: hypothetical protein ACE5JO_10015 [Candidatus Binatia bacterium]